MDHLEDLGIDVSQYGCDVYWCTVVGVGWVISCLLKTARWRFAAENGCGEEPESCGGPQLAAVVLLDCACRRNKQLTKWLLY